MNDLIKVTPDGKVTSRELYEFLQLEPGNYARWCKSNIVDNQFAEENIDWGILFTNEEYSGRGQKATEYWLMITFAKKLCMLSKSERGEQARDYFIEMERRQKQAEIDVTKLSPEMHMFKLIYDSVAKAQIESAAAKTIALESIEKVEQVQERFNTVKEAITNRDVNWREYINTTINKIVDRIGGKDYQTFRSDTYKLLEQRAGCDLSTRLRNLKARLEERGATKSAINAITKMDIIEEDKKIKEIYNTIIRELAVKYLA